ncbi:cytochrome P460 family protein [Thalassospira sp. MA62]|nr:cytochrome P460 family protein [Thalassospira sp. MA62]
MTRSPALRSIPVALAGLFLMSASAFGQSDTVPPNRMMTFPDGYEDWVHYGTFTRGGITEELFTSADAIAAAKAGDAFPDGTVIMMEDHRDGKLYRYVAMEKHEEWAPLSQSGSWLFREWDADRVPNNSEDGRSCESCHTSQESNDFVYTHDLMLDD